jgi:hypothetical protein
MKKSVWSLAARVCDPGTAYEEGVMGTGVDGGNAAGVRRELDSDELGVG